MLLTIATTHAPATDLGYLLEKHPNKLQTFELSYGAAHVFYPEATEGRCTAALLLDIDPVGMVRGRPQGEPGTLDEYVNDRPYVASSFLSVAIAQVLRSALAGRSRERPGLAEMALPFEITVEGVPCRGGEAFARALFEPLGHAVAVTRLPLDTTFPAWGDSRYYRLTLTTTARLRDVLSHLYVLIPVLDDEKHYWVGEDEVEKLLDHGGEWLAVHPQKKEIATRYLKHRRTLTNLALDRLVAEEGPDLETSDEAQAEREVVAEAKLSLNEQRIEAVVQALTGAGARTVLDLGCGEGRLVRRLLKTPMFTRVVGVDVSPRAIAIARARLRLDEAPSRVHERVELLHGALTYRDARFEGFDAAALVEVIEHIDLSRLPALERVVFQFARPATVVVTTPNAEYNVRFDKLPAGALRHGDHRFEWTRGEFATWADNVGRAFGYSHALSAIGDVDDAVGAPTQMAVFSRAKEAA